MCPSYISERGSASESRRPKIVRFYSRTNEKNIKPHYLNARTFFFLPDLFRKYHSSCRTTPKNILSKSIPRPPQLYHPGFKIDYKKKSTRAIYCSTKDAFTQHMGKHDFEACVQNARCLSMRSRPTPAPSSLQPPQTPHREAY